jgi:enamine deaminase RidA (YjgF/YER057c/UK114 family)
MLHGPAGNRGKIELISKVNGKGGMSMSGRGVVEYLNPRGLHRNPAFTHVVTITGPARTIYVGGQNALTAGGEVVGRGDLAAQTERILHNVEAALAGAGAALEHLVKWNVYILEGEPIQEAFEVFRRVWGSRGNPPAVTVTQVSGFANPDFLAEMDAVAVLPEASRSGPV